MVVCLSWQPSSFGCRVMEWQMVPNFSWQTFRPKDGRSAIPPANPVTMALGRRSTRWLGIEQPPFSLREAFNDAGKEGEWMHPTICKHGCSLRKSYDMSYLSVVASSSLS